MEGSNTFSKLGSQIVGRSASLADLKLKTSYQGPSLGALTANPVTSRNNAIYTSTDHLHRISIRDMVNMTLGKNDTFGIDGYHLPIHGVQSKG